MVLGPHGATLLGHFCRDVRAVQPFELLLLLLLSGGGQRHCGWWWGKESV